MGWQCLGVSLQNGTCSVGLALNNCSLGLFERCSWHLLVWNILYSPRPREQQVLNPAHTLFTKIPERPDLDEELLPLTRCGCSRTLEYGSGKERHWVPSQPLPVGGTSSFIEPHWSLDVKHQVLVWATAGLELGRWGCWCIIRGCSTANMVYHSTLQLQWCWQDQNLLS